MVSGELILKSIASRVEDYLKDHSEIQSGDGLNENIQGYKMLVESGNEENAKHFMAIKMGAKLANREFINSLEIVNYMKENGIWI